ncbi:hypothetical protein MMC11_001599 [Xylographa trunciseda]|nr:hypothetical protein [Xylographa trunciseda]
MAQVTVQSELMTQTLAAQTVGSSDLFCLTQDENKQPMLFSIGDQGQMYLTLPGPDGNNKLVPLNTKFKIPLTSSITTLSAKQDSADAIYLVFSEHFNTARNDAIHVMVAQTPSKVDWINSTDLTSYLLKDESSQAPDIASKVATVKGFNLGDNGDDLGFPYLALTYVDPSGSHTDIASIQVSPDGSSWTFSATVMIPEEADPANTAITVTSINSARGLSCLYSIAGTQKLAFMGYIAQYDQQVQAIHELTGLSTNCVASFSNQVGDSVIVLGAENGLYYYPPADAVHSDRVPTVLSNDPAVTGVQELYITTSSSCTTIWLTNGNQEVVYHQVGADMSVITPPTVLLPSASGGRFATLFDESSQSQHLFALNKVKGSMTVLSQSGESRLWKSTPYVIPSTGSNYDFISYSAHINIVGADGLPVGSDKSAQHVVQLSSSSTLSVIANGTSYTITGTGTAVPIGADGNITVLIPTDDVSTPLLYVTDVPGAKEPYFNGKTITIDAAHKVKDGLSSITDADSLKAQAGPYLPSGTSSDQLTQAGSAIPQIHQKAQSFTATALMARHIDFPELQSSKKDEKRSAHAVSGGHEKEVPRHYAKQKGVGSFESLLWDSWHSFENGMKEVEGFALKTLEIAGKEVLHIVFTVLKVEVGFALTCLEYCYKALSWILKTYLGIQLPDLIKWLGFLFEWDDIMDTQKIVVKAINEMITLSIQEMPQITKTLNGWMQDLEKSATESFNKDLPPPTASISGSNSNISTTASSDQTSTAARTSPGANWLNYQVKYGGSGSAIMSGDGSSFGEGVDGSPVPNMLSIIEGAFSPLYGIVKEVCTGLLTIFEGGFTMGDVKKQMQQILQGMIHECVQALSTVVNGVIDSISDVLIMFQSMANEKLTDIPLFSVLWEFIGGNETFSALNVVSLMLAVPVTILTKAIIGKAPSALPAFARLNGLLPSMNEENYSAQPIKGHKRQEKNDSLRLQSTNSDTSGVSPILDALGDILEVGEPIAGLVSMIFSVVRWYDPDGASGKPATALGFVIALIGFPTDVVSNVRPAFTWRALESTMDFVHVFFVATVPENQARAFMMGVAFVIRGIFTTVSAVEDLIADKTEYPALNYDTLWLEETCRWMDVVANLANCVALAESGLDPYSAGTYLLTTFVVFAAESYNAAKKVVAGNYENSVDAPSLGEPV